MPRAKPGATPPETGISVDLNEADPSKAVDRRATTARSDIAEGREQEREDRGASRTPAEREMFKRMRRMQLNMGKQFDQRVANLEAQHQRETAQLKARLDQLSVDRGGGADAAADAAHEAAINALRGELEQAYEKGDSAKSAEITLKISKLDAQFWAKKAQAAGQVSREDTARQASSQERQAARPGKATGPTAKGSRFITANEEWWEDPDFQVEKDAVNSMFVNLRDQEGFDPNDVEMYREIVRRLKPKFPKVDFRTGMPRTGADDDEGLDEPDDELDEETSQARETRSSQRRAPSARLEDRGQAGDRQRSNRRTVTAAEMETMRKCGLDPDKDRDVVQFLREVIADEAATS